MHYRSDLDKRNSHPEKDNIELQMSRQVVILLLMKLKDSSQSGGL